MLISFYLRDISLQLFYSVRHYIFNFIFPLIVHLRTDYIAITNAYTRLPDMTYLLRQLVQPPKMAEYEPHWRFSAHVDEIDEIYRVPEDGIGLLPCTEQGTHTVILESTMATKRQIENNIFYIFGNRVGIAPLTLRERICNYVRENSNLFNFAAENYLKKRGKTLDEWTENMRKSETRGDELAIYAASHLLKMHTSIDHLGGYWSTFTLRDSPDHDTTLNRSDIHMVYMGDSLYCEITDAQEAASSPMNLYLKHNLVRCSVKLDKLSEESLKKVLPSEDSDSVDDSSQDTIIYNPPPMAAKKKKKRRMEGLSIMSPEPRVIGTIYTIKRRSFLCEVEGCNHRSSTRKLHTEHVLRRHRRRYKCGKCGKIFRLLHTYRQHRYTHKEMNFECKRCGKEFFFHSVILRHLATHQKKGKGKFVCHVCGERCKRKHDLSRHLSGHGDKDLHCTERDCAFSTTTQRNLNLHMRRHRGELSYKCPKCGQDFNHSEKRRRHLKKCKN